MKALIAATGMSYPFTHKLESLIALLLECGESLPATPRPLVSLTAFAVDLRYDSGPPLLDANRNGIRETVAILREHILTRIHALESADPAQHSS